MFNNVIIIDHGLQRAFWIQVLCTFVEIGSKTAIMFINYKLDTHALA